MKKTPFVVAILVVIVALSGCDILNKPVSHRVTDAVDQSVQVKQEINRFIESNKRELKSLLKQAELTKKEREYAVKLRDIIERAQEKLAKADEVIADAKTQLGEQPTYGDLLAYALGIGGTMFGIPGMTLASKFYKKSKMHENNFASLVNNIQVSKRPTADDSSIVLDKKELMRRNADAGINTAVNKVKNG